MAEANTISSDARANCLVQTVADVMRREPALQAVKIEQTLRERARQNGKVSPRNGDGQ